MSSILLGSSSDYRTMGGVNITEGELVRHYKHCLDFFKLLEIVAYACLKVLKGFYSFLFC